MRLIIFLATIFSSGCCFSILDRLALEEKEGNSILFEDHQGSQLNHKLTDEEISRCLNFTDKISEDLNQAPTQEDLKSILYKCSLLLQRNSNIFTGNDEYYIYELPLLEYYIIQNDEFIPEVLSKTNSSKEMTDKDNGTNEILNRDNETAWNGGDFLLETLFNDYEELKAMSREGIFEHTLTTQSSGFWDFFFGTKSKDNDSSTEKSNANKSESQIMEFEDDTLVPTKGSWSIWNFFSDEDKANNNVTEEFKSNKPGNQKIAFEGITQSSTEASWSFFDFFFDGKDSEDASNENLFDKNMERGEILDNKPDFETLIDIEYPTTTIDTIWNIVMPGFKWCGSGNVAKNDDDLGYFEEVDRCCEAHDKCDDIIEPGGSKYNLTNISMFTILNCKCDDELYDCLSDIDSITSNAVGKTFFNIFNRMCYTLDYPRICKRHNESECVEYEIDTTAEKVYQWKSAKKYLKMPYFLFK